MTSSRRQLNSNMLVLVLTATFSVVVSTAATYESLSAADVITRCPSSLKGETLECTRCDQLPMDFASALDAGLRQLKIQGKEGPYGVPYTRFNNLARFEFAEQEQKKVSLLVLRDRQFYNSSIGGTVLGVSGDGDDAIMLLPIRTIYTCPFISPGMQPEDYSIYGTVVELMEMAAITRKVMGVNYPVGRVRIGGRDRDAGMRRLMMMVLGAGFERTTRTELLPPGFFRGSKIAVAPGGSFDITVGPDNVRYRIEGGGAVEARFDGTIRMERAKRLDP